jgi:hypothetical protein
VRWNVKNDEQQFAIISIIYDFEFLFGIPKVSISITQRMEEQALGNETQKNKNLSRVHYESERLYFNSRME